MMAGLYQRFGVSRLYLDRFTLLVPCTGLPWEDAMC